MTWVIALPAALVLGIVVAEIGGAIGLILPVLIGTVPINSATADWQLSAPPKDWKAQVTHAKRFHSVGVWAAVLAFACLLIAMALKLAVH